MPFIQTVTDLLSRNGPGPRDEDGGLVEGEAMSLFEETAGVFGARLAATGQHACSDPRSPSCYFRARQWPVSLAPLTPSYPSRPRLSSASFS
jgi:hypothetical protein